MNHFEGSGEVTTVTKNTAPASVANIHDRGRTGRGRGQGQFGGQAGGGRDCPIWGSMPALTSPQIFEPCWRKLSVAQRVLDITVTEVCMQGTRTVSHVGQPVPAGVLTMCG